MDHPFPTFFLAEDLVLFAKTDNHHISKDRKLNCFEGAPKVANVTAKLVVDCAKEIYTALTSSKPIVVHKQKKT